MASLFKIASGNDVLSHHYHSGRMAGCGRGYVLLFSIRYDFIQVMNVNMQCLRQFVQR
jgi:hypothetical protein